jgi:hypothetical protein
MRHVLIITICSVALIVDILRIIHLLFRPSFLSRFRLISGPIGKREMTYYYLVMIILLVTIIINQLETLMR